MQIFNGREIWLALLSEGLRLTKKRSPSNYKKGSVFQSSATLLSEGLRLVQKNTTLYEGLSFLEKCSPSLSFLYYSNELRACTVYSSTFLFPSLREILRARNP